jgi:TRAP-type C4-dicarboxylate transport system substrate-binding protein
MVPDLILMSQHIWLQLSPQQQQWLQQAMADSVHYQKQLWQQASDDALAKVKAHGVQLIYPDKTPFIAAVQPLLAQQQGTVIGDLLQQINHIGLESAKDKRPVAGGQHE